MAEDVAAQCIMGTLFPVPVKRPVGYITPNKIPSTAIVVYD